MPLRKLGLITRTYRHLNRYRQILSVLARYGFDDLVDRLRITQYLGTGLRWVSRRPEHVETLTTAERLRLVLEELGPTFVKLGQMLSTRPDLLPPDFIAELAKLQQGVPPFPFVEVREIIEAELGRPLDDLFERFDKESLAAASIGQVHRAKRRHGEEVVVKVQRPNIKATIEVDLEILLHLAMLGERHIEGWRVQRPSRIVEEFSRLLERELDYTIEATQQERFARQFEGDETIYVPKVFRDATTSRVMTLEYVDVCPVKDIGALRAAGFDPQVIAARAADLTLKQVFVHGYFHADPHPGNVFVLPGNVICLLDFGMMGRIDRHGRADFADLVYAVAARDATQAANALLRLTEHDDEIEPDPRRVERDVAEFIDLSIPAVLSELDFGKLLYQLLELVRRHQLRVPPDLVTMLKAAATVEAQMGQLDPDLKMIAVAEPYVRQIKLERLRPGRLFHQLVDSSGELLHLARELPGAARDLLRLAKRGGLKIGFEHRGLDLFVDSNERIANRISFAIVVAALIVGSSLIVHSRIPPVWHEVPLVGLIGFLAAGVMGVMLLWAIIRHGRL